MVSENERLKRQVLVLLRHVPADKAREVAEGLVSEDPIERPDEQPSPGSMPAAARDVKKKRRLAEKLRPGSRIVRAGLALINLLRKTAVGQSRLALRQLDNSCGRALLEWAIAVGDYRPKPPVSPVPELSPGEALCIGLIVTLQYQPNYGAGEHGDLLLSAARPKSRVGDLKGLGIGGDLARLVRALATSREWRRRIRRCDYAAGPGCFVYFADFSRAGDAWACSPKHSSWLTQTFGARQPRSRKA